MGRPEHLNCVNTAEGIRRINEEQRYYDEDPERYERQEREREEARQQEEQWQREEYERQQNEREDISFNASSDSSEIPF